MMTKLQQSIPATYA